MRFLAKVSLVFIILWMPSFLPPSSKSPLCPLFAWGNEDRDFGDDGKDGINGQAGRRGRDGESRTIFANGSPVNLDLSGVDGEDGNDGRNGRGADCGRQPRDVNYDLRAPDGGDGGNGGNGGDGGNGGALTVYYQNLADLQKIYVRSPGGRGGRGGLGANGGEGCECRDTRWEIQTCTGTPGSPGYSCKTERFSCTDGRDGRDGSDGSDGRDGQEGTLTLINRTEPLPEDQPTANPTLPELNGRVFNLSLNQWYTKRGAAGLLAPGSIIADQYREFADRIEASFKLVWNSDRPIADFYDQRVNLNLKQDKQIEFSLPEEVWLEATTSVQAGITQLTVTNAILESEATQLTRADFSGNGSELQFSLLDLARKSDLIDTYFRIKYRTTSGSDRNSRFEDYRTRYEGNIPAELVTRNQNRFTLALGKLPIRSEFLKPGVAVEIELVATRTFAGHSTEQEITWRGEIKR